MRLADIGEHLLGDGARRQHEPYGTRWLELRQHGGDIGGRDGAVRDDIGQRRGIAIVHHAFMPVPHQATRDVCAHPAEADDSDPHWRLPLNPVERNFEIDIAILVGFGEMTRIHVDLDRRDDELRGAEGAVACGAHGDEFVLARSPSLTCTLAARSAATVVSQAKSSRPGAL